MDQSPAYLEIASMIHGITVLVLVLALGGAVLAAEKEPAVIYDEAMVPPYTLPDPLLLAGGQKVTTPEAWFNKRRPELIRLFETHEYGKSPGRPEGMKFVVQSVTPHALDGKATRKQIRILFSGSSHQSAATHDALHIDLLLYLPRATGPVPVFLAPNFNGNHTIHKDPGILLPTTWVPDNVGVENHRATVGGRGADPHCCWPVEQILARGYGLVTAYYGDIEPDFDGGFAQGVHQLYFKPGQTRPEPDQWGSIAAWAWGLSRILDYLQTDRDVDARHVAVLGFSRLGKAALWAGACDQRFALVISNDSGCCGACLSKRIFGETVGAINRRFPHWFCGNFKQYNEHEERLPMDQHELIALIAPRPVYVASAQEDRWADPKGEFLGAKGADPVYRLLGTDGLAAAEMPPPEQPVTSTIGYHLRRGAHALTEYDWQRYLDFADRHLRR
jgi:hypothetical protein